MVEALRPNYWSAARIKDFCDAGLAWFDWAELSFGDLIAIGDVMNLAKIPPVDPSAPISPQDYQNRQFVQLRLLSAFREAVLEHRNRCLRQQGQHLRVLHPEEQIDYGEHHHTKAALQKLKRGQRIVQYTDTNDVQLKNAAIDRLKNVETLIHRQRTASRHPF